MQATTESKVWTEKELIALPKDGKKHELVNGELVMSPTGIEHEELGARLIEGLQHIARSQGLGIVCGSSAGFYVKNGNVRSPDVSFINKERLGGAKRSPKGFFNGAPDLAVEILSPSDTIESLHEKLVEYFESGTRLSWVLNPDEQTVLVYHSPTPDRLQRIGDTLDGEDVVPGFSMSLADLFEELKF